MAFNAIVERKHVPTRERWERAIKNKNVNPLRSLIIVETMPDHLWQVLKQSTGSTNVHLRELHSFVLGMSWPPWPVITQRQWPKIRYGPKRAITLEEHRRIVEREHNSEYQAFYELCWHFGRFSIRRGRIAGGEHRMVQRGHQLALKKTLSPARLHIGPELEKVLRHLPNPGFLFPRLAQIKEKHRAKEFRRRCNGLNIVGITCIPIAMRGPSAHVFVVALIAQL